MSTRLRITNGPDKPALQWALAYPDHEQVHFNLEDDAVDARISYMSEQAEGFTFALKGTLASGTYKGRPFEALYSVDTRSGSLKVV